MSEPFSDPPKEEWSTQGLIPMAKNYTLVPGELNQEMMKNFANMKSAPRKKGDHIGYWFNRKIGRWMKLTEGMPPEIMPEDWEGV